MANGDGEKNGNNCMERVGMQMDHSDPESTTICNVHHHHLSIELGRAHQQGKLQNKDTVGMAEA